MFDCEEQGDVTMEGSPLHPHPHPPLCPCADQIFVLSSGVDVNVEPGKEVNQDFTLETNPFKECGTLSGIVRDKHGHGIPYALVKVFDKHHKPVTHVFTNSEGQYLLCITPGHYILKAVK